MAAYRVCCIVANVIFMIITASCCVQLHAGTILTHATPLYAIGATSKSSSSSSLMSTAADIAEQETYSLYIQKRWKELEKKGTQALHSGIDYYYLRMRIGIALFEQKNFRAAISHFEAAYKFNRSEPTMLWYLYYSYLQGGRSADARALYFSMPSTTQNSIGKKDFASIQTAKLQSGFESVLSVSPHTLYGKDSAYGEQTKFKSLSYTNVGLDVALGPFLELTPTFGFLTGQRMQEVADRTNPINQYELSSQVRQYALLIKAMVFPGFSVMSGFHFMDNPYNQSSFFYDSTFKSITSIREYDTVDNGASYHVTIRDTIQGIPQYTLIRKSVQEHETDYVGFLTLTKDLGAFAISLHGAIIWQGSNQHYQTALGVAWYPFGNFSLYSNTECITHLSASSQKTTSLTPILKQAIGGILYNPLWYEIAYEVGSMKNYVGLDGLQVYTNTETVKSRLSGTLYVSLVNNKLGLSLTYAYCVKELSFVTFVKNGVIPISYNAVEQVQAQNINGDITTNVSYPWVYSQNANTYAAEIKNSTFTTQSFYGGVKWFF